MRRRLFLSLFFYIAAVGVASAQDVTLTPMRLSWVKVCGHDSEVVCYTSRNFGTEMSGKPNLALAVFEKEGEDKYLLRFLVPVGLRADLGLAVSLDGEPIDNATFKVCYPNGCFAELRVDRSVLERLKRATWLRIGMTTGKNANVVFTAPLAGFAAAFEGPGLQDRKATRNFQFDL